MNLTDENFVLFAAKVYERPGAVQSEFEEDLQRILYLKRLLTKYYTTGVLKDRLILNHLTVIFNVFGIDATKMLFLKLDERDLEVVKPFLMFKKVLPEIVIGINGKDINTTEVRMDEGALKCLIKLKQM